MKLEEKKKYFNPLIVHLNNMMKLEEQNEYLNSLIVHLKQKVNDDRISFQELKKEMDDFQEHVKRVVDENIKRYSKK